MVCHLRRSVRELLKDFAICNCSASRRASVNVRKACFTSRLPQDHKTSLLGRLKVSASLVDGRGDTEQLSGLAPSFRPSAVNMDEDIVGLVQRIHESPRRAVFYIAGGGLQVELMGLHDLVNSNLSSEKHYAISK